MNERDLEALYARWRAAQGQGRAAPDADAIAQASLQSGGEASDAALLEIARTPEALAAFRVARELAPNSAGLARALGANATRPAAAPQRVRPMVWAAAAAVALMVLVVNGVERRQHHAAHVASHDVINSGSFEGDAPPKPDTLFRSDFDG